MAVKARKYGIALLCAGGGAVLGLVLTNTFFIESKAVYYLIIIGSALVVALFGYKFEKITIIAVTSFIGSYGIVRGISLYAGGFPNELTISDQIKAGALSW